MDDSVLNTSQAVPSIARPPTLPIASTVVGLVAGVTGMCANAVVFAVLVFARRHYGCSVNTMIINQSAMDLFACIFLTVGSSLSLSSLLFAYYAASVLEPIE